MEIKCSATRLIATCCLVAFVTCVFVTRVQAQTWDGGGIAEFWTIPQNWVGDVAPLNNGTANIIMAGTNKTWIFVDVNQNIRSLLFNNTAGEFDIVGGGLTIGTGGIMNQDADVQTIGSSIVVSTSQTWQAASGPLAIAGNVTLNGNLIADVDASYMTIAGSMSGGGRSLTKEGTGVLNLERPNTYSGGTSVNAGTLRLQGDGVMLGTGNVSVGLGGTFDLNGHWDSIGSLNAVSGSSIYLGSGTLTLSGNSSVSGVISGSGDLAIGSAGTTILSGANTFTGTTTVDGTLQLTASERLADASDLVINATFNLGSYNETVDQVILRNGTINGTGTLVGSHYTVESGTVNAILGGSGELTKKTSGTITLTGANTYTGPTTVNGGTLRVSGTSERLADTSNLTVAGGTFDLQVATETVNVVTLQSGSITGSGTLVGNSYEVESGSIAAQLGGTAALTKSTGGVVTLSGANDYTGPTNVTAGTLRIGGSERLSNSTDLVISGGSFDLQSYNETVDTVTLQSGAITGTGTLTGSSYLVESGTFSAMLGGSAGLSKTTAGSVTLGNSNTYTGATSIEDGSLVLGVSEALVASNNVTILAGGMLLFGGGVTQHIDGLSGNGSVVFQGGNSLFIGVYDASTTFAGVISGDGNLIKLGSGATSLSGANTYTGTTTVNNGILRLRTASERLADSSDLIIDGAIFDLQSFSETVDVVTLRNGTINGSGTFTGSHFNVESGSVYAGLSGNASLTKSTAGTVTLYGGNTYAGTTTVNDGTLRIGSGNERLADSSNLTISGGTFDLQSYNETVDDVTLHSGSIVGTGTLVGSVYNVESGAIDIVLGGSASLSKSTAGTVTLNNANIYTGPTTVTAGTLALSVSNALAVRTADVTVAEGATLQIASGTTQSLDELEGAGDVVFAGDNSLSVGGNHGSSSFSGGLSGDSNLSKYGTGTLTLAGANTYTGTTTVSDGTLRIGGASERLADASDLTVNGGTFDLQSFNETVDVVMLHSGSITGAGTLTGSAYNVESGSVVAVLAGMTGLTKSTAGTVTLSRPNTYSGGTSINGGVLEISSDTNLGAAGTAVTFDGGALRLTNSFAFVRPITLGSGGGTFDTVGTTTVTSAISGSGTLTKRGLGTLVLNSVSPSLGGLVIDSGELQLPAGGTLNVDNAVTVGATGFMSLDGGLINAGAFTTSGEINLRSGARLHGPISNSGVLSGQGRLSGALTNNAPGEVRIGNAESLHFAGAAAHANAGLVEVIGGEIEFDAPVNNAVATGLIVARDASLRFDGGLNNSGSMALSFGTSDVFGDITNNAAASIVVSGGGQVAFYDDIYQSGSFRVSQAGSITSVAVVLGAFTGSGGSSGGGDVFFEGDLRPGNSTDSVTFDNDVALGSATELEIELGGILTGTQYDQVRVTRSLALGGALTVSLINGFSPSTGDSFDVLDWGSLSGTFATLDLPTLGTGLAWDKSQLYATGVLSVVLAGDYNANGTVDAADYVIWRNTLGQTGVGLAADGTGPLGTPDGVVDQLDRQFWRAHFGQTAAGGIGIASAGASDAIPEPVTLWLLMIAGGLLQLRCRFSMPLWSSPTWRGSSFGNLSVGKQIVHKT